MKHPVFAKKPCSDVFYERYIEDIATSTVLCEACQRLICVHPNMGTYKRGEYKRLKRRALYDSDRYVFLNETQKPVGYGTLSRMQVVFFCPCNFARFCEDGMTSGEPESPPIITQPGHSPS